MRPLLRCLCLAAAVALMVALPADAGPRISLGETRVLRPVDLEGGDGAVSVFQDLATVRFVLKPGRYFLDGTPALVLGRVDGVTICGERGRARDTVIETESAFGFFVDHCTDVTFQDLTIRTLNSAGEAIRLSGTFDLGSGPVSESFADRITVRRCILEGPIGVSASGPTADLTVVDSTFRVGDSGFGIVWQDGPGLFVVRSRFRTVPGAEAVAAVRVRGPFDVDSQGVRPRRIFLTRNRVRGDFLYGFDLLDVTESRVFGNRIRFPGPVQGASADGRVGIQVRRFSDSRLIEDVELRRNRVRKALFGMRFTAIEQLPVHRNDLRGCGSRSDANSLGLFGGAILTDFRCPELRHNDFRGLRSPKSVPAVTTTFSFCEPNARGNRVSRGRRLEGRP